MIIAIKLAHLNCMQQTEKLIELYLHKNRFMEIDNDAHHKTQLCFKYIEHTLYTKQILNI